MFSAHSENVSAIVNIFDIISLFAAELEKPKIGMLGKGLRKNFGKGSGNRNFRMEEVYDYYIAALVAKIYPNKSWH